MQPLEGEGPYRAVGPCWVQSIAALCSSVQARERNYLRFLALDTKDVIGDLPNLEIVKPAELSAEVVNSLL